MTTRYTREQLFQSRPFRTVRRAGVNNEIIAGADIPLFNVSGPVLVTSIFGVAVTAIAGAGTPGLQFTEPAAGVAVDLSAAGAIAAAVNDILGWTGVAAVAIAPGAGAGIFVPAESAWAGYFILSAGVISVLEGGGAAPTTGTIDWYISYLPLRDTTIITAL